MSHAIERMLSAGATRQDDIADVPEHWPLEVQALIQSMRRNAHTLQERRSMRRHAFLVHGTVWHRQDKAVDRAHAYTRDARPGTISFVTTAFLRKGQKVILEVPDEIEPASAHGVVPSGRVNGRICRCRQFQEGWMDCVMELDEPTPPETRQKKTT